MAKKCSAITKAGKRCKARPLKESEFCLAHDEKARETAGFGGAQEGAGRPAKPKAVDVLREKVEAEIEEWLRPLEDARSATRGIAISLKGGGMELVDVPDHGMRVTAVKEVLDRVYGKPKQATEITGADGGPIQHEWDLSQLTEEELRDYRRLAAKAAVA